MKTHFICLANSFKEGGLCMAGIEVKCNEDGKSCTIIRDENNALKWIRPVINVNGDALPYQLNYIRKADLMEIEISEQCPKYAHSENVLFTHLKFVRVINLPSESLNKLCNHSPQYLLHNQEKSVTKDIYQTEHYSLMLIKPQHPQFRLKASKYDKHAHIKVNFIYNGILYSDISVTDPIFIDKIKEETSILSQYDNRDSLYFTMSLGEEFQGLHYKIVASIFET